MSEDVVKDSHGIERNDQSLSSQESSGCQQRPYWRSRVAAALLAAVISDALSMAFQIALPLQWVLDVATALILFAILGWQPWLLPALIAEAIPGLATMPTWVLVVAVIAAKGASTRIPSE